MNYEEALVVYAPSPANFTYENSEKMMLDDKEVTARLTSIEDWDDEEDVNSVGSEENRDESTETMIWDFHDLQGGDHWGLPVLHRIR